ncbi:Anaphase-promoting complex subunit 1 [Linnemannia zychae]|nr:Anaphase-promoting complex subunit 1 [Linnemannia zychae]
MEITILGEYKPFGSTAPLTAATTPHSKEAGAVSSSKTYTRTQNLNPHYPRVKLHYGLYAPTYDDVVQGSSDNQSDSIDLSNGQNVSNGHSGASSLCRSGPRGYDVEIVVDGAKVTWTQGGILRMTVDFTSENEVIQQTLIAWLLVNNSTKTKSVRSRDREWESDNSEDIGQNRQQECRQQALIVVLKETIRVYFTSGETQSIHLPFAVHKVWALDLGLMLERKTETEEDLEVEQDGSGLARFYMTMDPLNEFQAIGFFRLPAEVAKLPAMLSQEDKPRIRYMTGTVGNILNTCVFLSSYDTEDKIVVTYDLLRKHHRVWRYGSKMLTSLPFSRNLPEDNNQTSNSIIDDEIDTDLQMRTDTYFYEIASDIQPASANSKITVAHALDGSPVVCIHDQDADKLYCYRIIANQFMIQLWTKIAHSALALEGTRKFYRDLLLLTPEGSLLLWTGYADDFIPCNVDVDLEKLKSQQNKLQSQMLNTTFVDTLGPSRSKSSTFKKDSAILELRDAVEDRFNIILGSGAILRARLDFVVRLDLIQQCLDAISYAMPVEVLWDFRHRFLQLQFSKDNKYDIVPPTDEWGNFSATLLSYCDPSFYPTGLKSPTLSSRSLPSLTKKLEESEIDWNFFLDSEIHHSFNNHPAFRGEMSNLPTSTSNAYTELIMRAQRMARLRGPSTRQSFNLDLVKHYTFILVALHLVYMDRSLSIVNSQDKNLRLLLRILARLVGWKTWEDYYARQDFSTAKQAELTDVFMEGETLRIEKFQFDPPDIFRWVADMVTESQRPTEFPTLDLLSSIRESEPGLIPIPSSAPCEMTRKVTTFFTALMADETDDQEAVRAIVKERFTSTQMDQLPLGISIPLREALWKCRNNPPPDLDSFALSFIGRNDLAELKSNQMPGYYMKPPSIEKDTSKRQDIATLCKEDTPQERENEMESTGTEIAEAEITNMRFGADMRVAETQKMLQSSLMLKIRSQDEPGLNEDDLRMSHQVILRKLALRTLALPVGRAILTFGTMTRILTQRCEFPEITLSAKILPVYGDTEFDLSLIGGEQALSWPFFNNGVAAGLRMTSSSKDISPSWIIYNRPENPNCNHAGFLLALGLTGHLKKVACVLGIGLLYAETSNRRMAEVMLTEIGSTWGHFMELSSNLQEAHSVAAGFGLGLITLGQGNKPMGLRDMKIVDVLLSYMPGSADRPHHPQDQGIDDMSGTQRHSGVDLTGTGATIAMGLMYLKTNNSTIAAKLAVPETQYLLDYLSPHSLMLRVICRAIILWDTIFPSEEWILSQVPEFLRNTRTGGPPTSETGPQSYYSIHAGACFAIGLRFAGSGNEAAYKCISRHIDMFLELERASQVESYEDSITMSTMRICLDVVTMAASMVIAGSGRIDFLRKLRKLHKRIKGDTGYAVEPRCLVTREASTGAFCPVPVTVHLKPDLCPSLQMQSSQEHHIMMEIDHVSSQLSQESDYTGLNPNVTQDLANTPNLSTKLSMMTPCLLPELSTVSKIEIKGPRYWPITLDLSNENEDYSQMWRILKSGSIAVMRRIGHLSYTEDPSGMRGILARPFPKVLPWDGLVSEDIEENGGSRRMKRRKLERLIETSRQKMPGGMMGGAGIHRSQRSLDSPAASIDLSDYIKSRYAIECQGNDLDFGALKDGVEPDSVSYGQDFSLTLLKDPQVAAFATHLCRLLPLNEDDGIEDLNKEELRASYFTSVLYECLTMDKVEVLGAHVWLYDIANRLENMDEVSWRSLWELRILKQYYETQMGRRFVKAQGSNQDDDNGGKFRMVEDDGNQTLIKVSRIAELFSEIVKRVDMMMKDESQPAHKKKSWRTLRSNARQYFASGIFLPITSDEGSARLSRKKRGQEGSLEEQEDKDNTTTKEEQLISTDWFKVWLELNRIPGPDCIQAMKKAILDTTDQRERYWQQQGKETQDRKDRVENNKCVLLGQIFSLAYPRVSLKVLEYLIDDDNDD